MYTAALVLTSISCSLSNRSRMALEYPWIYEANLYLNGGVNIHNCRTWELTKSELYPILFVPKNDGMMYISFIFYHGFLSSGMLDHCCSIMKFSFCK
ncbi:hypothetical protein TNIN_367911 [Trichonephila inaurata madagascariensis]|uniref:Uncharacterized protein n=1 Tax=Trichonephila inaurata madagascariensis TaxID=2747483 RepID=A0A8X7BV63_9ARAC|nr:hypothetical protein TNIN_367911 [Trichonephila inaurata madagascariensis]